MLLIVNYLFVIVKLAIENLKELEIIGGQENRNSIFYLAYLYDTGENPFIEKDAKKAIQLYEEAVKHDEPNALHNLALKKLTGEDTVFTRFSAKEPGI